MKEIKSLKYIVAKFIKINLTKNFYQNKIPYELVEYIDNLYICIVCNSKIEIHTYPFYIKRKVFFPSETLCYMCHTIIENIIIKL